MRLFFKSADYYKTVIFNNYHATWLGAFFTVICFLLYYTFIVPFFIMLPLVLPLELIFTQIYPGQGYPTIGKGIIISLAVIFSGLTAFFFTRFIKQIREFRNYRTLHVALYMILLFFVVHPLFFYIHLSNNWGRASNGQFILSITETFQCSSFSFVILGVIIDCIKILNLNYKQ